MTTAWLAAFAAGFVGSAHCVGMCGGISGLFGVQLHLADARRRVSYALAYNGGRLLSYTALGALAGLAGGVLISKAQIAQVSVALRLAMGLVIIAIGIHLIHRLPRLAWLERGEPDDEDRRS